jgi:hypothetical protein
MNREKMVEQRVEEALSSLDGMARATGNPYLFTRLQQRLFGPKSNWEKISDFVARPAFALVALFLFLAANFYVANQQKQDRLALEKQKNEQAMAAEFYISSNLLTEPNLNR